MCRRAFPVVSRKAGFRRRVFLEVTGCRALVNRKSLWRSGIDFTACRDRRRCCGIFHRLEEWRVLTFSAGLSLSFGRLILWNKLLFTPAWFSCVLTGRIAEIR